LLILLLLSFLIKIIIIRIIKILLMMIIILLIILTIIIINIIIIRIIIITVLSYCLSGVVVKGSLQHPKVLGSTLQKTNSTLKTSLKILKLILVFKIACSWLKGRIGCMHRIGYMCRIRMA